VRCTFTDPSTGVAHELALKIPTRLWHSLHQGGSLPIVVKPGEPNSARPGVLLGWKIRGFVGLTLMAFGGLLTLTFFGVVVKEMIYPTAAKVSAS